MTTQMESLDFDSVPDEVVLSSSGKKYSLKYFVIGRLAWSDYCKASEKVRSLLKEYAIIELDHIERVSADLDRKAEEFYRKYPECRPMKKVL